MKKVVVVAALGLFVSSPLLAQKPLPPQPIDGLTCQQVNGGVLLEWSFEFFAPIQAYALSRDGEDLTKLPASATSYFDSAVGAGSHVYNLRAINFTGELLDLAKCEVVVVDFGLRCKVDENRVQLEWGPILIDVLIVKFRISRDGDTIATVPPDQLKYTDEVFALGTHHYAVHAVTGPESEFLVGTCSADVSCFGLKTSVSGLDVSIAWEGFPTASLLPVTYIVTRDNQLVVKTQTTEAKDTVPGPGKYVYQVVATLGILDREPPDRIIGECIVSVPGDTIPPPRDLTCTVISDVPVPLDPTDPTRVDSNGDGVIDGPIPVVGVVLKWSNPIAYDKILITRNKAIVATIDGSSTRFVDRVSGGGEILYGVYGIVGNEKSSPAECKVDVPPPVVLPPQDFTCRLLDVILDPSDPDNKDAGAPGDDSIISPIPVVLLSWWNPVKYAKLFIFRDGVGLTRLPGDAMLYRDVNPGPGKHVYGIFGVLDDGRQSPTVECALEIDGGPVPPVANLQCLVEQPSNAIPSGSVILVWDNAAKYDKIVILRNGEIIFEDTGELQKFRDLGLEPGVYLYCVVAVKDNQRSSPTCCQVVISGETRSNLLYFSPGAVDPAAESAVPDVLAPFPGNRITCLADNVRPLQGWSFGVASDPQFIVPKAVDLNGTATEAFNGGHGPSFLHVEILSDGTGVVMGVVIDDGIASGANAGETLPPGRGHRLLNIEYTDGPRGQSGQAYPVRYTSTLGSPPVQTLFVVDGFETIPGTKPGWVSLPGAVFLRGDSNGDGRVDLSDAKFTLDWLFTGGREPQCLEAANANGSQQVNIADPVYTLSYLFRGGPTPPFPFPRCDTAAAPLGCRVPAPCRVPEPAGG